MADCCDPIEIPTNCADKCNQLVNACCVINEDNLPCIIPDVTITAVNVTNGSSTITAASVSEVLPNPFYGVITVTSSTPGLFEAGTTVDSISTDTVHLSKPAIGTNASATVVFTFTEQRQCDINAAVDEAICAINAGTVPCYSYTPITTFLNEWSSPGNDAALSNNLFCTVRMKGSVTLLSEVGGLVDDCNTPFVSQVFTIPLALRPAAGVTVVLSVTVSVTSITGTHYYPGILRIFDVNPVPPSTLELTFYIDACTDTTADNTIYFSLDGLSYNL